MRDKTDPSKLSMVLYGVSLFFCFSGLFIAGVVFFAKSMDYGRWARPLATTDSPLAIILPLVLLYLGIVPIALYKWVDYRVIGFLVVIVEALTLSFIVALLFMKIFTTIT